MVDASRGEVVTRDAGDGRRGCISGVRVVGKRAVWVLRRELMEPGLGSQGDNVLSFGSAVSMLGANSVVRPVSRRGQVSRSDCLPRRLRGCACGLEQGDCLPSVVLRSRLG